MFGQMSNFLNTFAEIGGFDAIIGFLKAGNETVGKNAARSDNLDCVSVQDLQFSLQRGLLAVVHLSSQRDRVAEAHWDD